ncbi:hypothetical protein KKF84_12530, partial [Myxococcota bacterium]|nr:hypothetical protein [Myxococcota bacterium]
RVFHFSLALFFVKAWTRMGFTLLNRVPLGKFNRVNRFDFKETGEKGARSVDGPEFLDGGITPQHFKNQIFSKPLRFHEGHFIGS